MLLNWQPPILSAEVAVDVLKSVQVYLFIQDTITVICYLMSCQHFCPFVCSHAPHFLTPMLRLLFRCLSFTEGGVLGGLVSPKEQRV